MKSKALSITFISLLLTSIIYAYAGEEALPIDNHGGLAFYSHQSLKENRSSAFIENNEAITFRKYFKMDFDFKVYNNNSQVFGDVCELAIGDDLTLKMILNVIYGGGIDIVYMFDGDMIYHQNVQINEIDDDKWVHIAIEINEDDRLVISDGISEGFTFELPKKYKHYVKFTFGKTSVDYPSDVAAFVIRNLKIWHNEKNPTYSWPLSNHYDGYARDIIKGKKLIAHHPYWLLDYHARWNKVATVAIPQSYVVKGPENIIEFLTLDCLYEYNIGNGTMDRFKYSQYVDSSYISNTFLWNSEKNSIEYFNPNSKNVKQSCFDKDERKWIPQLKYDNRWNMQGNAFMHEGNHYMLFGYGHYKYSDKIFKKASPTGEIHEINDGVISPRYLSGTGIKDDKLYICSGIGNENGEQILGISIYGDLYVMDLATDQIEELEDVEVPGNELPVRNLVFKDDDSFLSLFYDPYQDNSYLVLKRIFLDGRKPVTYCDSIPYIFNDMTSEAIFYEYNDCLYAVTKHQTKDSLSQFSIYTTNLPLFSETEILLVDKTRRFTYLYIILFLITCAIIPCIIYFMKHRRNALVINSDSQVKNMTDDDILNAGHVKVEDTCTAPGIYLLGGFKVINQDREDITGNFTPVMKQLLSLIILYTLKDDRGISNTILKDLLWLDKSDESAINNRSVNIRKIRLQISKVGNFRISLKSSYWKFHIEDGDLCDVFLAYKYLTKINKADVPVEKTMISNLLNLAYAGNLLPNQNFDFFDDAKSLYSNMLLDALNKVLSQTEDPFTRLSLANAIIQFSPLDEFAITVKCSALSALGKHGLAKQAYNNFSRDYLKIMGEEFSIPFDQIIK